MNNKDSASLKRLASSDQPFSITAIVSGLVLSILCFALVLFSARYPTPVMEDAAPDVFSAERAMRVLENLLAEGVPHPVGSDENRRVKMRIITHLKTLGLNAEEQHAVACHARAARCGFVENVTVRIPGSEPGPALLLMSHYDSVPMSPGAGDDGAGVAAMLEVARILTAEAPFRNTVILLFTDGEEVGLLGAEAFFGQHPWAQQIGVVLNVEGSGSAGESLLLRTGPGSGWVVDAFRDSVSHPSAASVADEVFKRMPNDTDFSVSQRAGLPGADFAFAGERNHYHSPLDTVENLSQVTVQHHGENLLPLARKLASIDLATQQRDDRLYHTLAQTVTISWAVRHNLLFVVVGFVLLALASIVVVRSGETSAPRLLVGTLVSIAIVLTVIIANFVVFKLLDMANGTVVAWPAHTWPFRLCLVATTLATLLIMNGALGRFLDFWSALLGTWNVYFLLAVLSVVLIPVAANLFLIPLLGSSTLIAVLAFVRSWPHRRVVLAILTLAIATLMTLPVAFIFEQTQGYQLIIATFPFVALFAMCMNPLLQGAARPLGKPLLFCGISLAVGFLFAVNLPLYSEWRPQPINIAHIEDHDQGVAHWMISSPNPVPKSLLTTVDLRQPQSPVLPWYNSTSEPVASAPASGSPAPEMTLLEAQEVDNGRQLRIHVKSPRGANNLRLMIPVSAGLHSVVVNDQEMKVPTSDEDWQRISVTGVPGQGFDMKLVLASMDPVESLLLDWNSKLPAEAALMIEARAPLAAPVHSGDQSMVFTRVML